jgi:hypothetical protein
MLKSAKYSTTYRRRLQADDPSLGVAKTGCNTPQHVRLCVTTSRNVAAWKWWLLAPKKTPPTVPQLGAKIEKARVLKKRFAYSLQAAAVSAVVLPSYRQLLALSAFQMLLFRCLMAIESKGIDSEKSLLL